MSAADIIQVDDRKVLLALGKFSLSIRQNEELMREIGAGQLVSVRRTFRESGSPGGSWAPLAASTIARNPKKYGAGHKLLINTVRLLNSITFAPFTGGVTIGTNVAYAAAQQFGTKGMSLKVGRGKRTRAVQYASVEVEGRDGTKYKVPRAVTHGKAKRLSAKTGKASMKASLEGPHNQVDVKAHTRAGGIPARPFVVIRPEDPARIRRQVVAYLGRQRKAAGLAGSEGGA